MAEPKQRTRNPSSLPATDPNHVGRCRFAWLGLGLPWVLLAGSLTLSYWLQMEKERHRFAAAQTRVRADQLVDFMLFQLRDQLDPIGRIDILEQPARKALAYLDSLPMSEDSPEARHRRGVALDNIGEVLVLRGDLPAAHSAFQQAMEIAERLAREEADNPHWQRGLAISYSRIGDLQKEQGDLSGALVNHRKTLDILDRLAQQAPEDRERQYDLGLAHERMGHVLQAQGHLAEALKQYQARQIIVSTLNTLDPNHLSWRRDLAVSYGTIGDVYDAQGDFAGALAAYLKFAEIAEPLTLQHPDNAEWQRDFAISQQKIGDLHAARGDLSAANSAYRHAAEISERLAAMDPSNLQGQRDLAASCARLATVQEKQGKLNEALILQNQAADALKAVDAKLGTEESRRDAGQALGKLAWYYLLKRQPDQAVEVARKGLNLAPAELRITLVLAHALLLSGHEHDAEKIYRQNRQAVFEGEHRFEHVVSEDFRTLITRGIVHPGMRRIENGLNSGR